LKWYWWRFNANGFFWGMAAGIAAALVFPFIFPDTLMLYVWPLLFLISIAGCLIGTYTAPPTNEATLIKFYKTVRPWGFWQPICAKVKAEDPSFEPNRNFKLDMFNVVVGVIAQLCLTVLPMYLILGMKAPLAVTVLILVVLAFILKRTWWDKLQEEARAAAKEQSPEILSISQEELVGFEK